MSSQSTRPQGISTLVNHHAEGLPTNTAHVSPIYQTSAFRLPDAATGAAMFQGEAPGYYYTRIDNPNHHQVVQKIAALEAYDLWEKSPQSDPQTLVDGHLFASGMAAVTAAIIASVKSGETIIAQKNIYGATYSFLTQIAVQYQIQVVWIPAGTTDEWQQAFEQYPHARLAYAETPTNPNLGIVDLQAAAQIAHQHGAWLLVDNTFASPFCQRPFNLGADVVVHSTTKYLSGHGVVIGGIVLSRHLEWVGKELFNHLKLHGAVPSPFDAWLTHLGLKTFELRMQRHCENAMQIAQWLQKHHKVERVYYPGLPDHPGHGIAARQMLAFGGMLAFELTSGLKGGIALMNQLKVLSLVTTLGNVDTLVQHPASMSHVNVPREERLKAGVSDGLVRVSAGIENLPDLVNDLDQALEII